MKYILIRFFGKFNETNSKRYEVRSVQGRRLWGARYFSPPRNWARWAAHKLCPTPQEFFFK